MLFCLISCTSKPEYKVIEGQAQGTTFRINYEDSYQKDLSMSIDSIFKMIDKSMSLWDSTSLISKVNNNLSYETLDTHFINVFNAAEITSLSTNGYFDISVGPLVRAWGFSIKKGLPLPLALTLSKYFSKFWRIGSFHSYSTSFTYQRSILSFPKTVD